MSKDQLLQANAEERQMAVLALCGTGKMGEALSQNSDEKEAIQSL